MARDLFISRGLSAATIDMLARATRSLCDISDDKQFDIIHFLEVDVLRIMPDFYLFIEADDLMGGSKAFVTEDSKGIVVSESVYNDACGGLFYARKILAHEFGHILLHHNRNLETKHFSYNGYKNQLSCIDTFNSSEWQADTFALLLLIPASEFEKTRSIDCLIRQYKMSAKQATFVSSRLESIRTRPNTYNRRIADIIIGEMIKFRKNRTNVADLQYSLF